MRDYRGWVALLRAVVGGVWLFEAYPQVAATSSYLGHDFVASVQDMARNNPWHFYKQFLEGVVLTHAAVFSYLTLVGNAAIGVCLLLGILTPYAAVLGVILNVNYALAGGWLVRENYPLNGLLIVCELAIIALSAGRVAGVDALLAGGSPKRSSRRF
jgi:uncharacterized membrane protein YphA (DoxX/SURF4 family)